MTQFRPFEPQPTDVIHDCLGKILAFLQRVGIIKTEIGAATEFSRNAKVQTDGLGMANVQMTIRFRREPGNDRFMRPRFDISHYDITYKITCWCGLVIIQWINLPNKMMFRDSEALNSIA